MCESVDNNLRRGWEYAVAGARRYALSTRNEGGGVMPFDEEELDKHYECRREIARLAERETYLEMVIEAFLIQYGPQGVAEWAIVEARDARAELEKGDG